MRYPASEKLEIIRLVEQSHLPVKQTLEKLGVSRPTFYRPLSAIALQSPAGQRIRSLSTLRRSSPGGSAVSSRPRVEPDTRKHTSRHARYGTGET